MNDLFDVLSPADIIFQKREIGYKRAFPVVEAVKSSISAYRTDERFKQLKNQTNDLLEKGRPSSLLSSRPTRQTRRSTFLNDFSVEESLGERTDESFEMKSIFFEIIDLTISELNARFCEQNPILKALSYADDMDSNH